MNYINDHTKLTSIEATMDLDWHFINSTTRLPVDRSLQEGFRGLLQHHFEPAFWLKGETSTVDIFFVAEDDSDLECRTRRELPEHLLLSHSERARTDIDTLGVYLPTSERYHRPVIVISPERVMRAAYRELARRGKQSLPLSRLYPALLNAVIAHELAHAMMDECASSPVDGRDRWQWAVTQYDTETEPTTPTTCDANSWAAKDEAELLYGRWSGYVVEESLADAFVLIQPFAPEEREAVEEFIRMSPFPYNSGVRWADSGGSGPAHLLETMRSWRACKRLYAQLPFSGEEKKTWSGLPSDRIATGLGTMGSIAWNASLVPQLPVDFVGAFCRWIPPAIRGRLEGITVDEVFEQKARDFARKSEHAPLECSETVKWLSKMHVRHFTIADNGDVSVYGDVDLSQRGLEGISVKFDTVTGFFNCRQNSLTTLANMPNRVHGAISLAHNKIASLEGIHEAIKLLTGPLCLQANPIHDGGIGLVNIPGITRVSAPGLGAFDIIGRYLRRKEDIFECQAELINNGFESFAKL